MKRFVQIFLLSVLILSAVHSAYSNSNEQFFTEGNIFYQDGQYEQALQSYQKILDSGHENGAVYFNMANSNYKLNNLGQSILFYERALKLTPGDEDVQANLALANKLVVDEITHMQPFFLMRFLHAYYFLLPFNLQLWLAAGTYLVCGLFISLMILARKRLVRMVSFRLAIAAGILFIVFGFSLLGRFSDQKNKIEAVILQNEIAVRSAPGPQEGSVEVFALHEGTKVRIDREEGEWLEIVLLDGKVGWVERTVLEVI